MQSLDARPSSAQRGAIDGEVVRWVPRLDRPNLSVPTELRATKPTLDAMKQSSPDAVIMRPSLGRRVLRQACPLLDRFLRWYWDHFGLAVVRRRSQSDDGELVASSLAGWHRKPYLLCRPHPTWRRRPPLHPI